MVRTLPIVVHAAHFYVPTKNSLFEVVKHNFLVRVPASNLLKGEGAGQLIFLSNKEA